MALAYCVRGGVAYRVSAKSRRPCTHALQPEARRRGEAARRFIQLIVAQRDPAQPLGSRRAAGHGSEEADIKFELHRGDSSAAAISCARHAGNSFRLGGCLQSGDGGEHAQRRRHGSGRCMLRVLAHARRPSLDGLVELGCGVQKLARIVRGRGFGEARSSLSGKTATTVLRANSPTARPPGTVCMPRHPE